MTFDLMLALTAFAFVSSITPGPNNLMLMASGTNFGFLRTIPHMLGVSIGFAVMLLGVGIGLTQVFERFPTSYLALKIVSASYLLYLAWKIATAPTDKAASPTSSEKSTSAKPMTFLQAAAFQWVNPKAWTMGTVAISSYTNPEQPTASLLTLVGIFAIINVPCIATWTTLGTQMRKVLGTPTRLKAFNVTASILLASTLWPIITDLIENPPQFT